MQPEAPDRTLRLNIDSAALSDNWKALNSLSGKALAGAAVKADGYGVGARKVVPILRDAGCKDFFVAHFSEVRDIADLIDPAGISVLHGPMTTRDVAYAQAIGIKPVINSPHQARLWLDGGGGPCDVMVDTGMNRLGVEMSDVDNPAIQSLDIDILMSHLASADTDCDLNAVQRGRWGAVRAQIPHRRGSLANSAGIALGPDYHGDLTRPGLSLYGGVPRGELKEHIRQVVQPEAQVLQTRTIKAGDGVGYNSTFVANKPMRVGTVSIGYADGYLRCWSGAEWFSASGTRLPVLGRVSMDMTTIDLTDAPGIREGDWLRAEYSLPEAAAASGLSQYELLSLLGNRLSRQCD